MTRGPQIQPNWTRYGRPDPSEPTGRRTEWSPDPLEGTTKMQQDYGPFEPERTYIVNLWTGQKREDIERKGSQIAGSPDVTIQPNCKLAEVQYLPTYYQAV